MTKSASLPEKRGYSVDEVVALGVLGKRSHIYKMIAAGTLKARKCGKRTIILADDVSAAVEALPMVEPKNAA
jgi:hypothetical protein